MNWAIGEARRKKEPATKTPRKTQQNCCTYLRGEDIFELVVRSEKGLEARICLGVAQGCQLVKLNCICGPQAGLVFLHNWTQGEQKERVMV